MNRDTRPAKQILPGHHLARLVTVISFLCLVIAPAEAKKPVRLGLFAWEESECRIEAFHAGLRELGYVEGRDIVIECRHAGGRYKGLKAAAEAIVRTKPDVIVALHHAYAEALRHTGTAIPTVVISSGDPVATGLAASLARPGGSMTGLTYYAGELNAKRLELLKAVAPRIKRVAVLVEADAPEKLNDLHIRDSMAAAKQLGLELRMVKVREGGDLDRAFQEVVKWKADAVHVLPSIVFAYESQKIADLARWYGLPTMHFYNGFPALGGLIAYGPDFPALQRRAAVYVDKILKGAKPGELPIEQPNLFKLIINRETAAEFGLTIPPAVLLRADKVIE
jgi:putative ABC transport system substrate-binding protein